MEDHESIVYGRKKSTNRKCKGGNSEPSIHIKLDFQTIFSSDSPQLPHAIELSCGVLCYSMLVYGG